MVPSMKRNRQGLSVTAIGLFMTSSSSSFGLVGSFQRVAPFHASTSSSCRLTHTSARSRRQLQPWGRVGPGSVGARNPYLYEEEDDELEYYDSRPFREVDEGPALRRNVDEWSRRDDGDDGRSPSLSRRRRRYDEEYDDLFGPVGSREVPMEPEDELYGEEDEEEENEAEPSSGNFWFNPQPGLDRPVVRADPAATLRNRADLPPSTAPPHRRRQTRAAAGAAGKRTTFRSGTPPPPAPIRDLYNRLFWYGFDPSDEASSSPADPTMFGGTKGKFNGLAYLSDAGPMDRPKRRPRRGASAVADDDDDDDELYYYGEENGYEGEALDGWDTRNGERDSGGDAARGQRPLERERQRSKEPARTPVTPPYDPPMFMRSPPTEVPYYPRADSGATRRQRRPTSARAGGDDWVSREVSSWFGPEGSDNENESSFDAEVGRDRDQDPGRPSRSRRSDRRRRSPEPSWSLFGAVESFLGLDRTEMDARAVEYDRQMGIGRGRSRDGRQPRSQSRPDPAGGPSRRRERRKGYAYRYDDDDGTPPIAEVDAFPVVDIDATAAGSTEAPAAAGESASSKRETEVSWEERALAVERVPPAGIPAWGPTGDLGIDARTKAILDALEDIQLAKEAVNERKAAVEKAKEEVAILRIDSELEKKRLRSVERDARILQESLRQLEFEVQESSRALRYAQSRLQVAQDELLALERRHWAVLSFYNPTQVEEAVQDAIREFEQNEPAARLRRDQPDSESDPSDSFATQSPAGPEDE